MRTRCLSVLVLVIVAACGSSTPSVPAGTASPAPPSGSAATATAAPASASAVVGQTSAPTGSAVLAEPSLAGVACDAAIDRGVLPDWARAGFSDPQPVVPHAIGRAGEIAAILFGDPLSSPPSTSHTNKVLWVAREPFVATPALAISAQRMDGTTPIGDPVERSVEGGPGPSTVDLPAAGCWRLTLRWADQVDSLDLRYVDGG